MRLYAGVVSTLGGIATVELAIPAHWRLLGLAVVVALAIPFGIWSWHRHHPPKPPKFAVSEADESVRQ